MDNKYVYLLVFSNLILGVCIGLGIAYVLGLHAIEAIGQSFKVENMNLTVQLNQSMLMDALERINQSKATP